MSNTVEGERLAPFVEMAEAIANLSYQGVYIVDVATNKFIYVSEYPLLRCGYSLEEIQSKGFDFLYELIPDSERNLITNAGQSLVYSFREIPLEYKRKLFIHLNFHISSGNGFVMVCHKLQMVDLDHLGRPRLLLGVVSPSVYADKPNVIAYIRDTDYTYRYFSDVSGWESVNVVHLSEEELTMLRLSMQGYSMDEIGDLMFKSPETIKFYRRQVFLKLNVKNITEAIGYAIQHCLL